MRPPSLRRHAAIASCSCTVGLLLAPAAAGADTTSEYAPNAGARSFASSTGGWTNSSSFAGSCIPPLLCPAIANSHQATGGAQGDGFIRTAFTGVAGVLGVAGTATGVWESPQFSYAGADGQAPTSVKFTMDRQANVDQLLGVAGNSADFSVQLVNVSAPSSSLTLIDKATLGGAGGGWEAVPPVAVNPARLNPEDRYKIRIASNYTTGTSVVVTGSADYDNVVLRATRGGNGNAGGQGGAGGNGRGLTKKRLRSLVLGGMAGTAILKGNHLFVKVACPAKIGRTCRITAQGLLRKHRPATAKRTVKVRSGKGRQIVLRVKPKARAKVAKRKRLLVSEKVRAGKVGVIAYKNRKLIRR